MAERIRFLVTYDIRDPARLRRVHQLVVGFGERLQYSVYVCDLTRQELVRLRASLRKTMNMDRDSVSIFDLGPARGAITRRVEHLGQRADVAIDRDSTDPSVLW